MKETLKIAYLFLISHEPVLVFSINHDARNFRDKMSGGADLRRYSDVGLHADASGVADGAKVEIRRRGV
jgi:hypothetical protein